MLLNVADEVVGEGAELLDHGLVLVAVFVRADVDGFSAEHGVLSAAILREEAVEEGHNSGVVEVEVVHAVLLRTE